MAYRDRFVLSSVEAVASSLSSSVVITHFLTGPLGVPYCNVTYHPSSNTLILSLRFVVSGQYLKNHLKDSIQISHVVVTSFHHVPYFKVTLNSHV